MKPKQHSRPPRNPVVLALVKAPKRNAGVHKPKRRKERSKPDEPDMGTQ